ncbi:MAG: hypothetical protein DCC55_38225 [Chloroflexi bacterium]|nr:MAG: hypothetical protein DCC55_38225 [Chloroflexota bacterium]
MMYNPTLSALDVQLYYQQLLEEAEHERRCRAIRKKTPGSFQHLLTDLQHFLADVGHKLMGLPHAPVAR